MNGLGTNMVILVSIEILHRGRLMMVRLRLVVAMRLHMQLSSSRLRMSSNTPSCSEESREWNQFANPIRHAPSIFNSGLRNVWANRHNSRQDCNLEEHINQANRPSNSFTQGVRLRLHGLRGQEKVYQPSDRFSFLARNGDA
jgi:hypothetical protein